MRSVFCQTRELRLISALALLAIVIAGSGCGRAGRAGAQGQPSRAITALAREVPAFPGEPLVVLLRTPSEDGVMLPPSRWMPDDAPELRSDRTGERVGARMVWFGVTGSIEPESPWLPAAQRWRAWEFASLSDDTAASDAESDAPEALPSGFGFWVLICDVPPALSGSSFSLDGIGLATRWFEPPPSTTIVARAPRLGASPEAYRRLGERLSAEVRDPFRQWRVKLLVDRIRACALFGPVPPTSFSDANLEAIARHYESRWRSTLDVLAGVEPDLASDLTTLLTSLVLSPHGEILPAWPLDSSDASILQEGLLSERSTEREKADLAREWLARQARAKAWVLDEAGSDEAAGPDQPGWIRRGVRIGIGERWGRRAVASFAPAGAPAQNATQIGGHESVSLEAPLLLGPDNRPGVGVARAGSWATEVPVLGQSLTVRPPGLLIGPLWPRWTMADWLAGRATPVTARDMAILLLERMPDGSWWLYVECRDDELADDDVVTIRFGIGGRRTSVDVGPGVPGSPPVERLDDRWSARVPVDSSQIEDGGRLRLGVTRARSGALWSWPRPMLPGQFEPGKAVIGLDSWGEVGPDR